MEAKLRQAIGDAYCASAVNQPTLALAHYQRAVDLLKRTLGSDHADTLSSMKRLARALADSGRFPEAVSLNKEVVKLLEAKFGPDHDETLWFMLYLGFTYEREGQDAEAIALYEKMMRLTKARAAGVGDGATWMGLRSRLSDAYERRKEFDKAEAMIREFVAISEQKEGKTSTLAAAGLRALGNCLLKQQKYAEAEQELRKSFAIQDEAYPDSWIPFNTRSMLGAAIPGQKRFSEAEPLVLTAYAGIKKREDQPPIDTDPVGRTIERLVELYTAWGKPAEAAQWKQALEAHQVAASQRKAAAK